ncbi:MAG: hypothetical protein JST83_05365 [Bacteroidetes bacterium]|nr:hypothetical protein [Bacteroidota bacterium]
MKTILHKFVELIPDTLEEGILYISIEYGTALHKCACGCGKEVVTPLAPDGWELTYNGKTVSLSPSIGNWNFDCNSHYWIRKSEIRWARIWSDSKINETRKVKSIKEKKHVKKKSVKSVILGLVGRKSKRK